MSFLLIFEIRWNTQPIFYEQNMLTLIRHSMYFYIFAIRLKRVTLIVKIICLTDAHI